jgi:hypothetical protein
VPLHQGRCWNRVGQMAHRRSSLLLADLHPKTLVVRMDQKSLLVLRILQTHHDHHLAVVLALLAQGCCPEERQEVVMPGLTGQREAKSQGRDSSGWKALLVELWQSYCHHCGMKRKMVQ